MKIGIITYPLNNNYGNLLQAYALTTVLKRMGHDVWFIDLQRKETRSLLKTHLLFIKRIIKKYILRQRDIEILPSKIMREEELKNIVIGQHARFFIDKCLYPKISPVYSSKELSCLLDKVTFDAVIAGSDQIWRPRLIKDFLKTMYFDFAKDKNIIKVVYAASLGTDQWEYSSELTRECKELSKKIHAISVREESGVALCKKYLGVDAQWVLDPTFLLDKEDYIKLMESGETKQSKGDLFCYILDTTEEKQEFINSVSQKLVLTPFYMGLKNEGENLENKIFDPVETWLRGFYDAKFVITDSFHGMAFSIIFNKPFLCIVNERRGIARFTSLANQFGLKDCLIFLKKKFSLKKSDEYINWAIVNEQLQMKRQESLSFLSF